MDNEFLTGECAAYLSAWHDWRGDRLLPENRDVNYDDVEALLATVSLLEFVSSKLVIFRLVGANITSAFGRDVTGENFLQMADPAYRPVRLSRIKEMITQPCGAIRVTKSALRSGDQRELEFLGLPIASDESGLPSLILSFCGVVGAGNTFGTEPGTDVRNLAGNFAYFDIGAGLPE